MQAGSKWGTKFMLNNNEHFILTDLADGLPDEELSAEALAMNTTEAAEVEIARRVRSLMVELRAASIEVPPDFEVKLLARVREDATVLDFIELDLDFFLRRAIGRGWGLCSMWRRGGLRVLGSDTGVFF